MSSRSIFAFLALTALLFVASCGSVSNQMPGRLRDMHAFLTEDDPGTCRKYHYNFERQTPRLYQAQQTDSILDAIEYIKSECGPATNLEVTRLLLLTEKGLFGDSLVGFSTIPQMLQFRSEQESVGSFMRWSFLYGSRWPLDNTHNSFNQFTTELAKEVASKPDIELASKTLSLFYSGKFDSAFSCIQSDQLSGTKLQKSYNDFVNQTKSLFPSRAHIALLVGSWQPRGNNRLLGNHPEITLQMGGEGKLLRADATIGYRFASAKNAFQVDSLGHTVTTDKFNSWLFGVDAGIKIIDNSWFSTDLFAGLGYDVIFSITEAGDPEDYVTHGSLATSIGLRQRIFLDQQSGWYVGGIVRYSVVDYDNFGGTDLSGNTVTISLAVGRSIHETLNQFLDKLNYRGNRRK